MKEEIRNPFNCISSNTRHYHGENKDNTLSLFANIVGGAAAGRPQRTGPSNCLAKTQVYAKPKGEE